MRSLSRRLATLTFVLAAVAALPSPAQVVAIPEGQSPEEALADARRVLEIAKIELRIYQQVEFPRKRRHLDAEVTLLTAEVDALKRRVREYKGFRRSRYSHSLLISLQDAELALLDAKLSLTDAREERSAYRRFHSDRCRLYLLKAGAARARVVALDRLTYGP